MHSRCGSSDAGYNSKGDWIPNPDAYGCFRCGNLNHDNYDHICSKCEKELKIERERDFKQNVTYY